MIMGAMPPQDPQVTRIAERDASRGPGGFWQTLPGILTAAGTFLAGLAGLAAVLAPHLFAPSSPRDATERSAKPPTNAPAQVMNSSAPVTNSPPGAPAQPAALRPVAPAPIVRSRPDPPAQDPNSSQPANDRYIASFASDGFVVLRSEPTIASAEIRRILVGIAVRCGQARWSANGYRWRRCVDQEGEAGYMADTFLRKA
jgi:hypothetical protein